MGSGQSRCKLPQQNDAGAILEELSKLYRERNAVYKDNWKDIGPVLVGFFPAGITLASPTDFIRFHLFMLALVKLTRYTNNWATGHSDSVRDAAVYLAMLDAADGVNKEPIAIQLDFEQPVSINANETLRMNFSIDLETMTGKVNHVQVLDENGNAK